MAKNGAAFDGGKNPAAFRKRFETLVSALRENATVSGEKAELLLSERLDLKTPRDAMPYVVDAVKGGRLELAGGLGRSSERRPPQSGGRGQAE
jgi:hypothetical protein